MEQELTRMLAVLADTAVTRADVPTLLTVLGESRRLFCVRYVWEDKKGYVRRRGKQATRRSRG